MLKRFAAIDIGSNTIKVKIADIKDQNTIEQVLYKDFTSGLGQNLNEKNIIEPSNLQVCIDGLKEIKNIIKNYKVDKFEFIATHALRKATNQLEIKNIIKLSLGIEINIISGEEEAMLTLYGILIDYPSINNCACINGGGGSTELSIHIPTGDQFFALEIGAVNLYSTCFKNETSINTSLIKTDQLITEEFSKIIPKEIPKVDKIFSVGGSIFNAGYIIKKDKERKISNLTNMKISEKDFESIINL
jgi:exopolyphosphatase/guanosine-5'-triphosphate,3'-diphosphate pyrophosphatase